MKIEIEITKGAHCWTASYSLDGIETHLVEAFYNGTEALRAVLDAISEELPL